MRRYCSVLILCLFVLTGILGCGGASSSGPESGQPPVLLVPTIVSFSASPQSIMLGEPATLSWSVLDAYFIELDNGLGMQPGSSLEVTPAETTTYTLYAENVDGGREAAVTVTVSCSVTFAAGDGGAVTGETSQIMPVGSTATQVMALPDAGYTFAGWSGEGFAPTAENPLTISNVRANLSITANFTPPPRFTPLSTYLDAHPLVASAIKWQTSVANPANAYAVPSEVNKVAWANWSDQQKAELSEAYLAACDFLDTGAPQVAMPWNTLTDTPTNLHPNVNENSVSTMERVGASYAWKLFLAQTAFSLALEVTNSVPWSLDDYTAEELRYLFDSTQMAWMAVDGTYAFGTYMNPYYTSPLRASNLPKTSFAPPEWVFPFLRDAGILKSTRLATIGGALDWMRQNMTHFIGADTFGTTSAVWQYRGYPPFSRIVEGTVDEANPSLGIRHWTAGCHGSVGFLAAGLRAVNIPVQPVWVCGHELAWFVTENLYLDHGDDPYNSNVRTSASPSLDLLIDEATYQSWFTTDLTVNVMDGNPSCPSLLNATSGSVGRRAREFASQP